MIPGWGAEIPTCLGAGPKQINMYFFVVVLLLSHVPLFATLWTVAHQVPLSMGFLRQEYWRGLPFPSPGDLPNPGIKPLSSALAGGFFAAEPPGKPQ